METSSTKAINPQKTHKEKALTFKSSQPGSPDQLTGLGFKSYQ